MYGFHFFPYHSYKFTPSTESPDQLVSPLFHSSPQLTTYGINRFSNASRRKGILGTYFLIVDGLQNSVYICL